MDFLKGSFLNQIKSKPLSKKGQCVLERCVCLCVWGGIILLFLHIKVINSYGLLAHA